MIALVDTEWNTVVSYAYDSWGNVTAIEGDQDLGKKNPLRYRGYYWDEETGLYYLASRYYDPEVGRFISEDDVAVVCAEQMSLCNKNMYVYCDNNPVIRKDSGGRFWITAGIIAAGGVIGAGLSAISSAAFQYEVTGSINWKSVGVAAIGGAISGAIAASSLGLYSQIFAGGLIGGASSIADSVVNGRRVKVGEVLAASVAGALSGAIGGEGANKGQVLTRMLKTSKKTMIKLAKRKGEACIMKRMVSTKIWRNNILAVTAWSGSAKFSIGIGVSKHFPQILSKVKT